MKRSTRDDGRLFVFLVLGGIVTFTVAIASGAALDATPGSMADWVAAVSTFAALLAATYAAVQAARTLGLEQRRDQDRYQLQKQRQAELVAAWPGRIEFVGPKVTHTWTTGDAVAEKTVADGVWYPTSIPVTIRNASEMPITNMTVDVYFEADGGEWVMGGHHDVVDVTNGRAMLGTREAVEIVTPELVEAMVGTLEGITRARTGMTPIAIGWTFTDNAGVDWRKAPDETLQERVRDDRESRPRRTAR